MKNVKVDIKGDLLILEVDLSKRNGPSGSGKTTIIGTTEGIHYLKGTEIGVGLNVFTKERK